MQQNIDYSKGIYDARQLGTGRMLILGIQHMFAMFGATVLVPLLTGLSVSTTLLCAGLGTLLFHFITKKKVPAFLGSSFAYLGGFSIVAPMLADADGNLTDGQHHAVAARVLLDGDDGGFAQDDALPLHIHAGIGGPQVDGEIVGKRAENKIHEFWHTGLLTCLLYGPNKICRSSISTGSGN